jgi:hypothetical protein
LRIFEVGDDAVKAVIGHSPRRGFLHPCVQRRAQGLSLVLNGEVDDGGSAAKSCRARSGFEIVGAGGAAEGHVEMSVNVNAAGQDIFVARVENAAGILPRKLFRDRYHLAIGNRYVGGVGVRSGDDGAIGNDGVECHSSSKLGSE